MIHFASPSFWSSYDSLPISVRKVADKNYEILKVTPSHPSLHFKKMEKYSSVRVGIRYRALAVEVEDGLDCFGLFWIVLDCFGLVAMLSMIVLSRSKQTLRGCFF